MIAGPRQCGKTTLVRDLVGGKREFIYDGGRPVPFGDRLVAAPMSCLWARLEFFAVFGAQWIEVLQYVIRH